MSTLPNSDLNSARDLSISIAEAIDPDEVFIVEENFAELAKASFNYRGPAEGHFAGEQVLMTFAAAVVTFVLTVLTDAVKDVLKKRVAEGLQKVFIKKESIATAEAEQLKTGIKELLQKSNLPDSVRQSLEARLVRAIPVA